VFNLRPPARATGNALGGWTDTVIYAFQGGGNDGFNPAYGNLIFDPAGNIYGTTYGGGSACDDGSCGTVFKLTPSQGGGWAETAYDFRGGAGGGNPLSGVVLDASGNLYGTTSSDSYNPVVYELTPAGPGWSESILYTFAPSESPQGGVILDGSGGLFGTTFGTEVASTVYQLSPTGGHWTYSLLYNFSGSDNFGPESGVVRDPDGNLYGTT
jgi:hypothetical protein